MNLRHLLLPLAAAATLAAASGAEAQPTLLLMHPSAFVTGDPSFEADAAAYAESLGFRTRNLDYPLCSVHSALYSTAVSANLNGPDVYAYGDSAGGTLAARLAERGMVKAAAAYSPAIDVPAFVARYPGVTSCLDDTPEQLASASLNTHPTVSPIVQVAATDDTLCPYADAQAWDAADPGVWTWATTGGHLAGGPPSALYEANMQRAIRWLAVRAGLILTGMRK